MKKILCLVFCLVVLQARAIPTNPVIKITPNPTLPASITQAIPIGTVYTLRLCSGQQVKLEAISAGTGSLTYQWIFVGNGSVVGNSSILTAPLGEGQYNVKITDSADGITITSTTTVSLCIEVAPPINALITSNGASTICPSGTSPDIVLTAQASNPIPSQACPTPEFRYEWYKDNVLISGANTAAFALGQQASNAGIYSIQVYNACGFASASFTIGIATNPPIEVSVYTDDASTVICPSATLTLRATTIGIVDTYQWFKQGNPTAVGTGNSLTVSTIGTYFVKAKNGCGAKDSPMFVVTNITPPTQVSLVSNPALGALCTESTILLAPVAIAGGTPALIEYFKNGNLIYSTTFPFINGLGYNATQTGSYTVKISNKCGSVTSTPKTITASNAATKAQLDLIASPPSIGCGITEVTLGTQSNGNIQGLQWYQDFVELTGETNTTLTTFAAGFYYAEVYSSCGVFYTDTVEVAEITDPPISTINLSSNTLVSCAGKATLTSTFAGFGTSYKWFKDAVLVATTGQNTYIAAASGSYAVQASNACGISALSNAVALTIKQGANKPVINAPAGTYICGNTGTIPLRMLSAEATGVGYQWLKDGLPIAGATTSVHNATVSGVYALRANTPANDCITQTSESIGVRFITAPTLANLSILLNVCETPITLRVLSDGNFLQYRWFWLDGITNPEVGNSNTYTPTASGSYTLSIRNDCLPAGVWLTAETVMATVGTGGSVPAPNVVSEPAGTDRICPNATLKLKAQAVGSIPNVAYRWFLGSEMIAGQTSSELIVSTSGLYRAEVYDSQNPACGQVSAPYSVFVRPTPTILLTYSPSLTFCEGDSIRLNVNAQQFPSVFGWSLGTAFLQNSQTLYAKKGGIYGVKAVYNAGTLSFPCGFELTQNITTIMLPAPIPEITMKGGLLESKNTAKSYQWNYENIPVLGANNPFYMPLDSGRYTLTITNGLGCSGTSSFIYHKGIYEGITNPLQIVPNPNAGSFRVTVLGAEASAFVQVFNATGQLIQPQAPALRMNSLASHTALEFRNLPTGVYLIQATVGKERYARKVIVY